MYHHTKRASGVEIVLLNNKIFIFRSAVRVLILSGYLMRLTPTMKQVRCRSYFWGKDSKKSAHISHLSFYFQAYCCGTETNCVFEFHSATNFLNQPVYIIGKWFDSNWSIFLNEVSVLHGNHCVLINDWIRNLGIYLCCVTGWYFPANFSWRQL